MRLGQPHLLWLLLVLPPVLALFFWWASRQRKKLLAQFIRARLLSALTVGVSPARRKIRLGCLILAVVLLIVALARPQYGFDLQKIEQRGLDIVVAVDTSKSMLAEDIAPDRLERAKLAALDLMQRAGSDRLGLVAFAGDAYLECPLTFDNIAFQQCVQNLSVNTLPEGGTSLAAAIQTAQTAFGNSDHYKVLVLLTDGGDNVGGALAAAKEAAKAGMKIFTIGVGTTQGALLRVTDANGNSHYIHDANGDVVKSRLNVTLLRQIAAATGGFYLPLRGADTMEILYDRGLAQLPKSEGEERLIRRYHEQYHWPLAAAILLLLAEIFLPERKRAAKTSAAKAKTASAAQVAVVIFGLCILPKSALASASSALREYDAGDYTNALQEFEQLAQANTNDLRLVFDAGAAAYRTTNYDEALSDFQTATLSQDLDLQQEAYYNLGNTLYRLGEAKFEPNSEGLNEMQQTWEQAVKNYGHALELNTNDTDAAYNLAFVKKQIQLIAELREVMRKAKLAADEAVQRNEYHQALEIMESLRNPIATKKFRDYITRLKNINAIVTPTQR
jgi:Ca-activated chloride channel homolog